MYADFRVAPIICYMSLNFLQNALGVFWGLCETSVAGEGVKPMITPFGGQWPTADPPTASLAKNNRQQNATLPSSQTLLAPWTECVVDLIGPWKIKVHGRPIIFKALTTINPVTNLLEIIRINDKSSAHIAQQTAGYPGTLGIQG